MHEVSIERLPLQSKCLSTVELLKIGKLKKNKRRAHATLQLLRAMLAIFTARDILWVRHSMCTTIYAFEVLEKMYQIH